VAKTGLALRGVRSNYHHQFGTLELFDGTRVSAVTHGSEQAIVAGDWQYREQLSTLFVPMTARASFPKRPKAVQLMFVERGGTNVLEIHVESRSWGIPF
jgi:hypothetical protein